MKEKWKALIAKEADDRIILSIEHMQLSDLPQGEVVIKVAYSSVNYKDSLATSKGTGVVTGYPMIPGIDLSGTVIHSSDIRFSEGDEVIVTGYGLGVSHYGGYSEYARVPAEWVVPLPEGLSLKDAMIIGTAGFTAALSIFRLEENHISPQKGPILVTGSTGGVGSFAVSILSAIGYEVIASTGKVDESFYLKTLGAAEVIPREEVFDGKIRALEKQRWAAAVDPVGGEPLASILSQLKYGGAAAVSGLTAGTNIPAAVFPFILRGVSLIGIDSVQCPMETRRLIWHRIASEWHPGDFDKFIQQEVGLEELPSVFPVLLNGAARGRTIVQID
ncbi:MAG: acryloyl-CoA reductase [Bacillus sp. (in: firmicutes)]